jgi:multiple antibiotic resistance protein
MLDEIGFFLAVTVSIFAIVDPFGTLPFFVGLTDGFSDVDRAVVLRRAVIVLGATLGLFAIAGRLLFAAFGFTLAAFEIAGGIILFLVAYEMLQGQLARSKLTPRDQDEAIARRDEISVVPLGTPLLAGPGAISTTMIYAATAGSDPIALSSTLIAIAITTGATFVVLTFGQRIFRAMGRLGVTALTRVMGLVLAAVGVQFVINGAVATYLLILHGGG